LSPGIDWQLFWLPCSRCWRRSRARVTMAVPSVATDGVERFACVTVVGGGWRTPEWRPASHTRAGQQL